MLLAVAATTTFSRSLDGWFSGRTRAIVENSYDVAKAYVDEHSQIIRTDIVNMVRDINGEAATLKRRSRTPFRNFSSVRRGFAI